MRTGIGFIGAGNHALQHMKEFARLDQASMVAVFDTIFERSLGAASLYPNLDASITLDDLLSRADIHAVVIATPAETHLAVVEKALRAGKHVLLEKPMAHTLDDAKQIVSLMYHHPNLKLLVGHVERFNRHYLDAKKAIDNQHVGIPRFISATRLSPWKLNSAGWKLGALDTAIHDIDLICWMMDDKPKSVTAQGTRVNPKYSVYDHVSYQIRFQNGALAQGHIGWVDFQGGYPLLSNAHPRMFIAGSHGSIQVDIWQRAVAVNNQQTGAYFWPDDVLLGYGDYHTVLSAQNEAFLKAIQRNEPLPFSPENSCLAVEIAYAAHVALQQDDPGWINLS